MKSFDNNTTILERLEELATHWRRFRIAARVSVCRFTQGSVDIFLGRKIAGREARLFDHT